MHEIRQIRGAGLPIPQRKVAIPHMFFTPDTRPPAVPRTPNVHFKISQNTILN